MLKLICVLYFFYNFPNTGKTVFDLDKGKNNFVEYLFNFCFYINYGTNFSGVAFKNLKFQFFSSPDFRVTGKIFWGSVRPHEPSEKATHQSEILDLGSHNSLLQHDMWPNFVSKISPPYSVHWNTVQYIHLVLWTNYMYSTLF